MNPAPSYRFRKMLFALLAVSAVFFLFTIFTNSGIIPQKSSGSFEYVRKADELLQKHKFVEAIAHYEKAYAASPESIQISHGLVNAYTDYAEAFAESEKFDQAIAWLLKARAVVQNASTAQNLAVMYAKRALRELRSGGAVKAGEDLAKSREAAAVSNNARKSLAATLYSDAAGEYNAGRAQTALVLLQEALLSDYDWRICEFLGNIYYRKHDLEQARSYFEKALSLNPDAQEVRKDLEKLAKEITLAKNDLTAALPHFELRYDKSLPIDVALVNRVLETAYGQVGKDLGYSPQEKTTVFFYSTVNFKEIFRMPGMVRAFYDGNIRMPFPSEAMDERALAHYIFHEYAHAVVSAKTNNNCPAWLSEGIATWEDVRMEDPSGKAKLKAEVIGGRPLSIDDLNTFFTGKVKDAPDTQAYYFRAYTFVRFVVDSWGEAGLRDVLARIAGGQHVVNAIDDRFLVSEKELERRWNEYAREKLIH